MLNNYVEWEKKATQGYCVGSRIAIKEKMKFHPHPVRRSKEENKLSAGKSRTSYVSVTRACNKPGAGIGSWKLDCNVYFARAPG